MTPEQVKLFLWGKLRREITDKDIADALGAILGHDFADDDEKRRIICEHFGIDYL